jgi:putative tricarboxylic transport membrane protein
MLGAQLSLGCDRAAPVTTQPPHIAFPGNGESMPAILGGQVSVGFSTLAAIAPHIEAGLVRVLGVSSAERLPSPDAPTLREQGVDVELGNRKTVVAPLGISEPDRQRLEASIVAMAASEGWRRTLERYRRNDRLLTGPPFLAFMQTEEARLRRILRNLDAGASDSPTPFAIYPGPRRILPARRPHPGRRRRDR